MLTIGFAPVQRYMGERPKNGEIPRQQAWTKAVTEGAVRGESRKGRVGKNAEKNGWRHIGQTAFKTFRPRSDSPFSLSPGDELCFPSVSRSAFDNILSTDTSGAGGAETEVLS